MTAIKHYIPKIKYRRTRNSEYKHYKVWKDIIRLRSGFQEYGNKKFNKKIKITGDKYSG